MQVDYLIVGQGICGTFLSRELQKAGRSFLVIDDGNPASASRIASGIINPVTGRRIVTTWMIDELMAFAVNAYREMESYLEIKCFRQKDVLDFFPTPQMRLAYLSRLEEDDTYIRLGTEEAHWNSYFNIEFGYGMIHPCYLVDLPVLLPAYRSHLAGNGSLREIYFDPALLEVFDDHVRYEDISAGRLVFCDGAGGSHDRFFQNLPFAPNKGEALIIQIDGLPSTHIYKKGISIVPWKNGQWWAGSSHEWRFESDQPTEAFRNRTMSQLKSFLKTPFTVTGHLAAVRPATLERRPFIGFHPLHPVIGILNGMGTKGCSLAPYFANQLAGYMLDQKPLLPEADIGRFRKILSRG